MREQRACIMLPNSVDGSNKPRSIADSDMPDFFGGSFGNFSPSSGGAESATELRKNFRLVMAGKLRCGPGLWKTAADVAEVPGVVAAKPSVNGTAASRFVLQAAAHNKVVECEEMWAARRLQQEMEERGEERLERGRHPGSSRAVQRVVESSRGGTAPRDEPHGTGRRRAPVTTESIMEAREAAARRKLKSVAAAKVREAVEASCGGLVGREERRRAKAARKAARAERRTSKAEMRAAKKARH